MQDRKKEEKKDEISLEDLIEKERTTLSMSGRFTKVTLESFLAWKKRKVKEKKDAAVKDEEKKRDDFKAGRQHGVSTFIFLPLLHFKLGHLVNYFEIDLNSHRQVEKKLKFNTCLSRFETYWW